MSLTKQQLLAQVVTFFTTPPKITAANLRTFLNNFLDSAITGVNQDNLKVFEVARNDGWRYNVGATDTGAGIQLIDDNSIQRVNISIGSFSQAQIEIKDASGQRVSILEFDLDGKIFIEGLPTSNPSTANQLWNDGGTLKIA